MADITIKYNNSTIATINNTQTEILDTSGKYLEDDIKIEYVKPAPNLQTDKYVTPSANSQTIHPDAGYEGLAYVYVNPISPRKTAQTYTPTTTNQTIAAGRWLTGAQTIKGDTNLVAGNIKKDVSIFGVTGTYEGSSDLSTCSVTITSYSEDGCDIFMPLCSDEPGSYTGVYAQGGGSTDVVNVILYKGTATGDFDLGARPSSGNIVASGGVSYDYANNIITITGDGTILMT